MKSDTERHKEAILTSNFTGYLKSEKGYVELFNDANTSGGDPFDSAGIIGGRLVFIEYKDTVSPSQIWYEKSKGSSIEKKVAELLRSIRETHTGRIYEAVHESFSANTIPLLIIAVNRLSARSLETLEEMLNKRSKEWCFNFRISKWADDGIDELAVGSDLDCTKEHLLALEPIPVMKSTAPRRGPRLTQHEIRTCMQDAGLLPIYEAIFTPLAEIGCTYKLQQKSFNLSLPDNKNLAMCGSWIPKCSKEKGLLLTINISLLQKSYGIKPMDFVAAGLVRNTQKVGNLGFNAFVNDIEVARRFTEIIIHSTKTHRA